MNTFEKFYCSDFSKVDSAQNYVKLTSSGTHPFEEKVVSNVRIKTENDSELNLERPCDDNCSKPNTVDSTDNDNILGIKQEYSADALDPHYSDDEEGVGATLNIDTNLAIQTNIKCVLEEEEDEDCEDQSKKRDEVIRRSLCEIRDDTQSLRFKSADCRYSLNPACRDTQVYNERSVSPTDDRGTSSMVPSDQFHADRPSTDAENARNGFRSRNMLHIE